MRVTSHRSRHGQVLSQDDTSHLSAVANIVPHFFLKSKFHLYNTTIYDRDVFTSGLHKYIGNCNDTSIIHRIKSYDFKLLLWYICAYSEVCFAVIIRLLYIYFFSLIIHVHLLVI